MSPPTEITRYKAVAGGTANRVASSQFSYDQLGRLTTLGHSPLSTAYTWTYDALNRVDTANSPDGFVDYSYDAADQLTSANHSTQTDETYGYDANGNRTNTGYVTSINNRLASDGTHTYLYDLEGNRTRRTVTSTGAVTQYEWDHRNRLTKVTERVSLTGAVTKIVEYTYDIFDRRIAKEIDLGGNGSIDDADRYVYDGEHIALVFNNAGSLTNRILHGAATDQVFSDEQVTLAGQAGNVLWALTDNQGTVRDLVNNSGTVVNHIRYDSFGKRVSETNAAVDHLFGFTGRELDEETGLQYNRARYYDSAVGRFVGEDPIGFAAGDANLSRYVGNSPTNATDPSGAIVQIAVYGRRRYETGVNGSSIEEEARVYVATPPVGPNSPPPSELGTAISATPWQFKRFEPLTGNAAVLARQAAGDPAAEREVAYLLNAAANTYAFPPINGLGYFFPNTFGSHCARWGQSLNDTLTRAPVSDFGRRIRIDAYPLRYPLDGGPEHFIFLVKVRGTVCVLGIDNGAFGGPAHIFRPEDVINNRKLPEETRTDLKNAVKDFMNK